MAVIWCRTEAVSQTGFSVDGNELSVQKIEVEDRIAGSKALIALLSIRGDLPTGLSEMMGESTFEIFEITTRPGEKILFNGGFVEGSVEVDWGPIQVRLTHGSLPLAGRG